MFMPDVNVLVYAHREETPDHAAYRSWLEELVNSDQAFGMSDLILSGFLRIVTHPRILNPPSPLKAAWAFASGIRNRPNCVSISPGPRHWEIFARLCRENGVRGNLIPDAYLAALAIEYGCEWITTDSDYARFPGLRWRHPLRPHP
jgi:toxin-antitoxin system PIN domain toxin